MENFQFNLDAFEGPMDLLLHLIQKHEIDINNIPIAKLTDQYMEYMSFFTEDNMDSLSEFLVMASTLLEIKSKMLLPNFKSEDEDDEDDPRLRLVRCLIEYKKYKDVVEVFKEKEIVANMCFFRDDDKKIKEIIKDDFVVDLDAVLGSLTKDNLFDIFKKCMLQKASKTDTVRSGFGKIVKEPVSIAQKSIEIQKLLKDRKQINFYNLLKQEDTKAEIVVTFLAVLDLARNDKILIMQEKSFGNIILKEKNGGFDDDFK